jgi:hypothetical protein
MQEVANFRIKKYGAGWVSEIRKPKCTFFGIRYKWTHYISVSGMSDKPWFFSSRKFAEQETLKQIERDMFEYDYK